MRNPGGSRGFFLTLYIQYSRLNLTKLQILSPLVCDGWVVFGLDMRFPG